MIWLAADFTRMIYRTEPSWRAEQGEGALLEGALLAGQRYEKKQMQRPNRATSKEVFGYAACAFVGILCRMCSFTNAHFIPS